MLSSRVGDPVSQIPSSTGNLTPSQRAILYTILYGEIFDFPLTAEEVIRYRPGIAGSEPISRSEIEGLVGDTLASREGYLFWNGQEHLVAERARRRDRAKPLWRVAARYARLLRYVPFVRMVAVCGSLAMENTSDDGDVDIFIIAADRRVWLVHTFAMVIRRLIAIGGVKVCPNYFLSRGSLEARPANMFTAREVAQAVPLWGSVVYEEFLAANRWIRELLPSFDSSDRRCRLVDREPALFQCLLEWFLGGGFGDWLDGSLHRLLIGYFKRRWSRHDSEGRGVETAYRRDRQEVVGGGYAPAVRRSFRRLVHERMGSSPEIETELKELFPPIESTELDRGEVTSPFQQIFEARYGSPE